MVLRLRGFDGEYRWLDGWPLLAPVPKITSAPYDVLRLALTRYVRGEVPGRALLIGGYRGSGKTSLVRHAVEQLSFEVLRALGRDWTAADTRPRRPLLVRLHGPSLLIDELIDDQTRDDAKKRTATAGTKKKDAKKKDALAGGPKADAGKEDEPKPEKAPDNLLSQITIALYRALAHEFEVSYTAHAQGGHQLELAAEFELDLDSAVSPAALRTYWSEVDRLHEGVLWPETVGASLAKRAGAMPGFKEIAAIATAGQAYQVCIGAVGYSEQQKGNETRATKIGGKAPFDVNQAIGKVGGLAAGGAAGVGALGEFDILGATLIALAAGVAANFALSWTETRSSRDETSIEYSFIRDRSVRTLDRDLPLVIQRIREAGLAPVFVIDELDKLGTGGADSDDRDDEPDKTIAKIINRLKHLTTDFGFFCFLTDRDYFERYHRRLENAIYPREHTYFSERLLVYYKPQAIVDYLNEIIVVDDAPGDTTGRSAFAKRMLCRLIAHRSLLSAVNVERELSQIFTASRESRDTPESIVSSPMVRLHVAVQLAIEHTMRGREIRERMERDPLFAQLATDALYLISRKWMDDDTKIDLARPQIARMLLEHLNVRDKPNRKPVSGSGSASAGGKTEKFERLLHEKYGSLDLTLVVECVHYLASLLCDFASLEKALANDTSLDDDARALLVAIAEAPKPALLKRGARHVFHYLYDPFARDIGAAKVAAPVARDPAFEDLSTFFVAVRDLFDSYEISPDVLVATHVLPPTFSWNEIQSAWQRYKDGPPSAVDLMTLKSLPEAFKKHGRTLAAVIGVGVSVAFASGREPEEALQRIERLLDFQWMSEREREMSKILDTIFGEEEQAVLINLSTAPDDSVQSVRLWRAGLDAIERRVRPGWGVEDVPRLEIAVDRAWGRWRSRLERYFVRGDNDIGVVTYAELVIAAKDLYPSSLLRRDLRRMNALEWSELALEGGRTLLEDRFGDSGRGVVPAWGLHAGLLALGFDREALQEIPQRLELPAESGSSPPRGPGTLVFLRRDDPLPDTRGGAVGIPLLPLYKGDFRRYIRVLRWLGQRGIIGDFTDEA